jgi:hypothetical protein
MVCFRRYGHERYECIEDPGVVGTVDHRSESLGALGMTRAGQMIEIRLVRGEQDGHLGERYRR